MLTPNDAKKINPVTLSVQKIEILGKSREIGDKSERGSENAWAHVMRLERSLAHVDYERTNQNMLACHETGGKLVPFNPGQPGMERVYLPGYLEVRFHELVTQHQIEIVPTNTTYWLEVLFSFSAVWFRDGSADNPLNPEKVGHWLKSTHEFVRSAFDGSQYGVFDAAAYHADETTPHHSAFIFPVAKKPIKRRGRLPADVQEKDRPATWQHVLCASRLFTPDRINPKTGKVNEQGTISKLRDRYTEYLKANGIDAHRGLHQPKVQQQKYRANQKPSVSDLPTLDPIILPAVSKTIFGLDEGAEDYRKRAQIDVDQEFARIIEKIEQMQQDAAKCHDFQKRADGYYASALEKEQQLDEHAKEIAALKLKLEHAMKKLAQYGDPLAVGSKRATPHVTLIDFLTTHLGLVPVIEKESAIFALPGGCNVAVHPKAGAWHYLRKAGVESRGRSLAKFMRISGLLALPHFWKFLANSWGEIEVVLQARADVDEYLDHKGSVSVLPTMNSVAVSKDESAHTALCDRLEQTFGIPKKYWLKLYEEGQLASSVQGDTVWRMADAPGQITQGFGRAINLLVWPAYINSILNFNLEQSETDQIICASPLEAMLLICYKSSLGLSSATVVAVNWRELKQDKSLQRELLKARNNWVAESGYSVGWEDLKLPSSGRVFGLKLPPKFSDWTHFFAALAQNQTSAHSLAVQTFKELSDQVTHRVTRRV